MKMPRLILLFCLLLPGMPGFAQTNAPTPAAASATASAPYISTFSIVARDPESGDFGIAVQSRYFAVGEVVPHAAAEVGAIATQARGNPVFGQQGLELLRQGRAPDAVIELLLADDPLRAGRQLGVVDARGRSATYTGGDALPWAGGRTGENYAVQGNLLAGPQVVNAIATGFELTSGDFATRLVSALAAGQAAGGDARGRQSAALLVVRTEGGYQGLNDRYINLHVEDHPTPIRELNRLLKIRQAQLVSTVASELLERATDAEGTARNELLAAARAQILTALDLHPEDEYGWWLLARIRLLENEPEAAAAAAQRALLENPTWRGLPAATRAGLGVEPEMIDALLAVESFRRVWDSLAAPQ